MKLSGILGGMCALIALSAGQVHAAAIGPAPYLCFYASAIAGCGDKGSPFKGVDFSSGYFYLEDFEDNALDTPGSSVQPL